MVDTPHLWRACTDLVTQASGNSTAAQLNAVALACRHLLVKVIDRILYKLDEMVRPFVHKILVVIEPLLIDEDYYAR